MPVPAGHPQPLLNPNHQLPTTNSLRESPSLIRNGGSPTGFSCAESGARCACYVSLCHAVTVPRCYHIWAAQCHATCALPCSAVPCAFCAVLHPVLLPLRFASLTEWLRPPPPTLLLVAVPCALKYYPVPHAVVAIACARRTSALKSSRSLPSQLHQLGSDCNTLVSELCNVNFFVVSLHNRDPSFVVQ